MVLVNQLILESFHLDFLLPYCLSQFLFHCDKITFFFFFFLWKILLAPSSVFFILFFTTMRTSLFFSFFPHRGKGNILS